MVRITAVSVVHVVATINVVYVVDLDLVTLKKWAKKKKEFWILNVSPFCTTQPFCTTLKKRLSFILFSSLSEYQDSSFLFFTFKAFPFYLPTGESIKLRITAAYANTTQKSPQREKSIRLSSFPKQGPPHSTVIQVKWPKYWSARLQSNSQQLVHLYRRLKDWMHNYFIVLSQKLIILHIR